MSKEIVKLCTCDFVSLYGVQFLKIYMYPFFMQSMLNSCLYFSILLFLHKQTHNLYPEQKKIILNKCILYVFFDYCYSDTLLSQMNYFSTEVIREKSRGGRFLWNKNWDLGWIWAGSATFEAGFLMFSWAKNNF